MLMFLGVCGVVISMLFFNNLMDKAENIFLKIFYLFAFLVLGVFFGFSSTLNS